VAQASAVVWLAAVVCGCGGGCGGVDWVRVGLLDSRPLS
jgi:hypothetical protein